MRLATWNPITLLVLFGPICVLSNDKGEYNVGVGIADITGPAAGIAMMGYANLEQTGKGIHTRLFSRAFIFQSRPTPPEIEAAPLVVFVSADVGMIGQAIKMKVVERLQELYPPEKGSTPLFTRKNVLLSGTHTHSGPGAYLQFILYQVTSLGFDEASLYAIVDGIVESIQKAYNNLQPGKVYISEGRVDGASINRSPTSYDANPQEEKEKYDGNVDKEMVLLRIESEDGKKLGSINWFAVHPTSMNNTNRLVSGDNKGYASMLFEYEMNPGARPGKGDFVAAFASTNLGDVSPNIAGPRCIDTGKICDLRTSTCPGDTVFKKHCIAFGPGQNMEESTEIVGRRQYIEALKLFKDENGKATLLKGPTNFVHQSLNMEGIEIKEGEHTGKKTCKPALGFSFAAGTIDGPGMFDFQQGDTNSSHLFWDIVKGFLQVPSKQERDCQFPKPILLAVGELGESGKPLAPFDWVPSTVETQILQIGNLYLVGFPGELTTMSGRHLRRKVAEIIPANESGPKNHVVIAGLSNVYSHYVTTFEEYQEQRYEAAATIYGPHTLQAYLEQYSLLVKHLFNDENLLEGPLPNDFIEQSKKLSLLTPPKPDRAPWQKTFGSVLYEAPLEVNRGETLTVKFAGGHPRHNIMRGGTFLLVEREVIGERWEVVATDADWSTKFQWSRPHFLSSESVIEISWKIPPTTEPGFYRIRHFGYYRPDANSPLKGYQGSSAIFKVRGPGTNTLIHPSWASQQRQQKPSKITNVAGFWRALTSPLKKNPKDNRK